MSDFEGQPLKPRKLTDGWLSFLEGLNLPHERFHDLRHTHATQLLAAGVRPKIASERPGHSTIDITLDLYSHVMPGMQANAAAQIDEMIRRAVGDSSESKGSKSVANTGYELTRLWRKSNEIKPQKGIVSGGTAGLQIRLGQRACPGWVRPPLPSAKAISALNAKISPNLRINRGRADCRLRGIMTERNDIKTIYHGRNYTIV